MRTKKSLWGRIVRFLFPSTRYYKTNLFDFSVDLMSILIWMLLVFILIMMFVLPIEVDSPTLDTKVVTSFYEVDLLLGIFFVSYFIYMKRNL